MKFFNDKGIARYRTQDGKTHWQRLWSDYDNYLESIRAHLSPSWQELADADFHDHRICSVDQPSKFEFVMDLEEAKLTFTGVKFVWVPKSAIGDCWVYWEVAVSDRGGIDLEIRLAHDDVRIIADEVSIARHKRRRSPGT